MSDEIDKCDGKLGTPNSFQYNFHFTSKRGHFILAINIFCLNLKAFFNIVEIKQK